MSTTYADMDCLTPLPRVTGPVWWRQLVADAFALAEIGSGRDGFVGGIRTFEQDGLRLSRVEATGHVLERTARHMRVSRSSGIVLCIPVEGNGMVIQDGKTATVAPGDAAVYDLSRPYTLVHEGPFACLGASVPKEAFALKPAAIDPLVAVRFAGSDPLTAAVTGTVRSFEMHFADMPAFAQRRLVHNLVDLLETLCLHHVPEQGTLAPDAKSKQLDEVLSYIDDHLHEPDLDPSTIAGAHFMSVRALHNLAAERGTSMAAWIRHRRLERCRDDLANPALSHLGVAAVGARSGLVHAAHFSKLFKRAFGVTPSAYRASCSR